ncbi:MAG: restriction endonuclease subunit S [Saprospiraceae bacterium]|nr:restriction endonuclease subunit S [Saprospiraceae bacterium]
MEMINRNIKYKKTGFDWMPKVPEHWIFKRAKALFQERSSKGFPNEPLLAASQKQGVVLKEMLEQRSMEAIQNFESFKLVEKDDFVISLRSFEGGIELAYFRGIISPVYSIFYFRDDTYNRDYFKYVFKSRMFIQELNVYKKGIRDGQSISYSEFANIYLPVPPKNEQDEIVLYIKAQEEKINLFIQKKQRFIELLKEQRQNVIMQAVIKGIDNNVKLKPSKNELLDYVPLHWKEMRLKNFINEFIRGPFGSALKVEFFTEEGFKVYEQKNAIKKNLEIGHAFIDVYKLEELKRFKIKARDFLMSCSGSIGKIVFVSKDFKEGIINQAMLIMRPDYSQITEDYFELLFESDFIQSKIIDNSLGSAMLNLVGMNIFRSIKCPLPPIEEQKQIVSHIKSETATIDTAIAKAEREIELIKEYKEAMVSEAVMGKRK